MKKTINNAVKKLLLPLFERYEVNPDDYCELQTPPDKSKGDFSVNTAMRMARIAKCPPMKLALEIQELLEADKYWFEKVQIANPGFVNVFIKNECLCESFYNFANNTKDLIDKADDPQTIVIDYSSVNIAKQMHVGHLRSTIIGDVLARVLEALGNKVIAHNHLGDWGLPMAMVLCKAEPYIDEAIKTNEPLEEKLNISMLEKLYKEASEEVKNDPQALKVFHDYLIRLQNSETEVIEKWKKIVRISMNEVYKTYKLLDVRLKMEDEQGESSYRHMLAETVKLLEQANIVVESQGAKCVFHDEFKSKDGQPLPVIIQKSDGGYNYSTFDLAAVRYRTEQLNADRIIYVTDARQSLHFKQIFATAQLAKFVDRKKVELEHITFGSILGEDKKPLKTRSGENVKLSQLLDEAVEKAFAVVSEKNPGLQESYKKQVAQTVGIGAIKYADLCQNRNNDYVFSFERMLALNGNTAPYLQYAHARICSIFRKANIDRESFIEKVIIKTQQERNLILAAMEFNDTVVAVGQELRPHILCNYLYELASSFTAFYDKCNVVKCEDEQLKNSRLTICFLISKILRRGLNLLGISALEEM